MDRHSEASARPTVAYAVLGLLARRPRSGYEIATALRDPVSFFWSAPHSQLYPTLAALETDGLAEHEQSPGPGPRARKTYRITDAGRQALADWAVTSPPPRGGRDEFVLRAYSAWVAKPDAVAALFRTEADRHRAQVAEYERFRQELLDGRGGRPPEPARPEFGNWLALHNGLGYERAYLEWCEWALDLLLAGDGERAGDGNGEKAGAE
jgi:DNA-binding PadR family transcriptional regulator